MSRASDSGVMLTAADIDEFAARVGHMWHDYNVQRSNALLMSEEVRNYVYATDINTTSASILPHKNRTHLPKLTEISDNLQSQYWEATLGTQKWFKFEGTQDVDREKNRLIEDWVRTKFEQQRFRETVGRQLLADFVTYGNAFAEVDYVVETDEADQIIYKGPKVRRRSPLDIVMNPQAISFRKSPKVTRQLVHISELQTWPDVFPNANFNRENINKAVEFRKGDTMNDWVEVLKERGLAFDGFNTYNEYFKSDLVEVLVYYGNVYDPVSQSTQMNRVVYVIDRALIIRNEPNNAPRGFDGLHHAGWRLRLDNLWGQGPLDNLVGIQYRINHLENLKADIFDIIAHPVLFVKGEGVQEPDEGYAPGAVYYGGVDEDVKPIPPDTTALNADTQIQLYLRQMEQYSGSLSETRGVRTPGEKTAFEVSTLSAAASGLFIDKARQFEILLEGILQEAYLIMMQNFDGVDYIETFNDISKEEEIREISEKEVEAIGLFRAIGSKYWSKRNRETVEMREFQLGPMQDPKIRVHISGQKLAEFYEKRLGLEDDEIIEPFSGVMEDVHAQLTAEAEAQRLSQETGLGGPGTEEGQAPSIIPGEQSLRSPQGVQSRGQPGPLGSLTG